jgi:nucleoside-diphosphate-sugar epimerase
LRGDRVYGVARSIHRFQSLASIGLLISEFGQLDLPSGAIVVHTIPPLPEPETAAMRSFILDLRPRRLIYISSTGVYGSQVTVSAETAIEIADEKSRRRIEEERWVSAGPWSSLILRPAAIYGPDRGVHVRVREGRSARGAGAIPGVGSGVVSRIHVDDLAAILEAGVHSDLEGAWPVADDQPCSSEEIALWCARLLRMDRGSLEKRSGHQNDNPATFAVAGRKVDGSKIRELLGVALAYPDYQAGILAGLAEETRTAGARIRT